MDKVDGHVYTAITLGSTPLVWPELVNGYLLVPSGRYLEGTSDTTESGAVRSCLTLVAGDQDPHK